MKVIKAPIVSIFFEKGKGASIVSFCPQPLNFHAWHSVCFPSLNLIFSDDVGAWNQTDRRQGQTEEVKPTVTCVMRAWESEAAEEGLRKVPDMYKDDLAQRRIQGSLASHCKAPSFVRVSKITEADLETWKRLKVSGKTRCVTLSPGFLLEVVLVNIEGIKCLPFCHFLYFHGWKKSSQNRVYSAWVETFNIESCKPHGWKTSFLIQPTYCKWLFW